MDYTTYCGILSATFIYMINYLILEIDSIPVNRKKSEIFYDRIGIPRYNVSLEFLDSGTAQNWNDIFNRMAVAMRNKTDDPITRALGQPIGPAPVEAPPPLPSEIKPPGGQATPSRSIAPKSMGGDCPYFGSMPMGPCGTMGFGTAAGSMDIGAGWGLGCPSGSYCYRSVCCTNPL